MFIIDCVWKYKENFLLSGISGGWNRGGGNSPEDKGQLGLLSWFPSLHITSEMNNMSFPFIKSAAHQRARIDSVHRRCFCFPYLHIERSTIFRRFNSTVAKSMWALE